MIGIENDAGVFDTKIRANINGPSISPVVANADSLNFPVTQFTIEAGTGRVLWSGSKPICGQYDISADFGQPIGSITRDPVSLTTCGQTPGPENGSSYLICQVPTPGGNLACSLAIESGLGTGTSYSVFQTSTTATQKILRIGSSVVSGFKGVDVRVLSSDA